MRRDVEATLASINAAQRPASPAIPTTAEPATQSKMRQAIARRMSQSKREAPHYYLLVDIDMTDAVDFRRQFNETLADGARVSIVDSSSTCLSCLALQRRPEFQHDALLCRRPDHEPTTPRTLCIAVALDDGLIAPGDPRCRIPRR